MQRIAAWWRQENRYRWMSEFFGVRGILTPVRRLMAVSTLVLSLPSSVMLVGDYGPVATGARVAVWAISVGSLVVAGCWWWRWPTELQAIAFAWVANAAIAAGCVLQPNPAIGFFCCFAFTALAGYVAFLLTAPHMVGTLAVAVGTAAVCGVLLPASTGSAVAVVRGMLVLVSTFALPFAVHALVHALMVDARTSDIDALTGLRNRRGLDRTVPQLLDWRRDVGLTHLAVILADLDGFKAINDTEGHAAGDAVLVRVADALRRSVGDYAVGVRFGGEEFVVVQLSHVDDAGPTAEALCRHIATASGGVTASVGIAGAVLPADVSERMLRTELDRLVAEADGAMYAAKRAGGDRVARHREGLPRRRSA